MTIIQDTLTSCQKIRIVGSLFFSPVKSVISLAQIISGFAIYIILKIAVIIANLTINGNSKINEYVENAKKFTKDGITGLLNSLPNFLSNRIFKKNNSEEKPLVNEIINPLKKEFLASLAALEKDLEKDLEKKVFMKELQKLFYWSTGKIEEMKEIIRRFPEQIKAIPIKGMYGLAHIFCRAANNNLMDLVIQIRPDLINNIPVNGPCSLGEVFADFASDGNIEGMQLIIDKFPNFRKNIKVNDGYGLASAYLLAASKGHSKAMNLITDQFSEFFKEIELGYRGLGHAIHNALSNKHFKIIDLIIEKTPKEKKIPIGGPYGLGYCFALLALDGNSKGMQRIIDKFPEFKKNVPVNGEDGLGFAFCLAAKYNRKESMELIINSFPDFKEKVNKTEENSIQKAFINSDEDCKKLLIKEFPEVKKWIA